MPYFKSVSPGNESSISSPITNFEHLLLLLNKVCLYFVYMFAVYEIMVRNKLQKLMILAMFNPHSCMLYIHMYTCNIHNLPKFQLGIA